MKASKDFIDVVSSEQVRSMVRGLDSQAMGLEGIRG